jgi:hypothetical protein
MAPGALAGITASTGPGTVGADIAAVVMADMVFMEAILVGMATVVDRALWAAIIRSADTAEALLATIAVLLAAVIVLSAEFVVALVAAVALLADRMVVLAAVLDLLADLAAVLVADLTAALWVAAAAMEADLTVVLVDMAVLAEVAAKSDRKSGTSLIHIPVGSLY